MECQKAEKIYNMIHYIAKWYAPVYYAVPEVACLLRVTPEKISHYIATGELKAEDFGSSYCITVENLKDFLILKSGGRLPGRERSYEMEVV
jgi:excisionase family DNA binding protein